MLHVVLPRRTARPVFAVQDVRRLQSDQYGAVNQSPRLLDGLVLDRFERRLKDIGSSVVDVWAPGLSDEAIDALTLPLGVALPEEARIWWGWHNGVLGSIPPVAQELLPGRALFSLSMALELWLPEQERNRSDGLPDVLLQPVGGFPIVAFACGGREASPVPLHVLDDWSAEPRLALPCIGDLVRTWISYIDEKVYTVGIDGLWQPGQRRRYPQGLSSLGVY